MIPPAVFPGLSLPPALARPVLASGPAASAGQTDARRTILIVEDEDILRTVVAAALAEEGFTVLQATHGKAALDLLARLGIGAIHLILLDMRMPIMDGWQFAAAYRSLPGATAPIVVMTAAQDAQAWGDEVAAAGTLSKPFELTDLLDTVERLTPRS